ncbi:hypothetical protein C7M46_00035 [Pediococcus pentosaceus]|uniref:hypothetical protein n=1 Tax=Pediococcus pentosaceus TaxID=1255 RepID=UPI001362D06E|nr:hypothetical protein [Pediococcus pentosaceus]MBU7002162.1 hypothetical protein [Pediococcus pentosaceus]QHM59392.1 hypothetical protein C7M46_00035 [Pediococcus pentosaceus]
MISNGLRFPDKDPNKVINDNFPDSIQIYILSALKRAYKKADFTVHDAASADKWLSFGKGDMSIFSRIKQQAVETEICKLIENGLLPFDYTFKYNKQKNYKYLTISNGQKFHMTVNQTSTPNRPAIKAKYRSDENTNFQTAFKLDGDEFLFNNQPEDEYLELNHGYQTIEPKFVCIGLPKVGEEEWQDKLVFSNLDLSLLENRKFNTIASGPNEISPDEWIAYSKRESND